MRFVKLWLLVSLLAAAALAQTPQTTIIGFDPCADHSLARTIVPINQAAAGPTTILAGVAGKRWYVCFFFIHDSTNAGNQNVGLVEGTGTNCSTVSAGLNGGTTAATLPNLSPTDTMLFGNGSAAVMLTATIGDNICYLAGGSAQYSGVIVAVSK